MSFWSSQRVIVHGSDVFMCGYVFGFKKSIDNGITWIPSNNAPLTLYHLFTACFLENDIYIVTTGGVTGFIGLGKKPMPLPQNEVDNILKRTEETATKPSPKIVFEKGEQVRVIEGPFLNFNGTIDEIHPEKGKVKVSVSIFGRSTPVELEYWQVEKI